MVPKRAALKQQELRNETNRIAQKYKNMGTPNLRKRRQHTVNEENLSNQVSIIKRRIKTLQKSKENVEDQ